MKHSGQKIGQKALLVIALVAITLGVVYFTSNDGLLFEAPAYENVLFTKNVRNQLLQKQESYHCIHDEVVAKEEKIYEQNKQYFEEEEVFEQKDGIEQPLFNYQIEGSDWKPIRVHFDFTNLANTDDDVKNFITKELIPAAGQFFTEFLKVQPLKDPLKIDRYYLKNTCGLAEIKIPSSHITQGVENTDVIFYIQAVSDEKENYLAYASNCHQRNAYSLKSKRPTVGYFAMNLFYLAKHIREKDPMRKAQWIFTTIHEMTHSLVFSPYHFQNFVDGELSTVTKGKQTFINAPSIKQLTQKHFNCKSAPGAPLEDEGGKGTAGAHWERKTFGNELMTGSSMYDSIISHFTAAVYEASGWYKVNQDKIGTLIWGKQKGCDIFENNCTDDSFCSTKKEIACSYDYSSIGSCQNDPLSDECAYDIPYSNTHCNYPADQVDQLINKFGGATGYTSRCWKTDLLRQKANKKIDAFCFESKCNYDDPNSVFASFSYKNNWYNCKKGQNIVSTKEGYTFTCPDVEAFCFSLSACPNSCFGRGTCKNGACKCYSGFSGIDCSKVK